MVEDLMGFGFCWEDLVFVKMSQNTLVRVSKPAVVDEAHSFSSILQWLKGAWSLDFTQAGAGRADSIVGGES